MSDREHVPMTVVGAQRRGKRRLLFTILVAISLLAGACTYQLSEETLAVLTPMPLPGPELSPAATSQTANVFQLPITVYILDDLDGVLSSARTSGEMDGIFQKVNTIWAPAGIEIEVQSIHRVEVPAASIQAIMNQQFGAFFQGAGRDFDLPDPSVLNAFYLSEIGGPNGITPGSGVFFVADEPSVYDERVTSHEIGHILGLYHTLDDRNRLMYPGANGMSLTDEEITVARYFARRLMQNVQ